MEFFQHYMLLVENIDAIFQLQYLIPLVVGVIVGIIGGALPGITITLTVIMLLPFTYTMDTLQALNLLIGAYVGGTAGGMITATLIGIPGTPSSVASTFDGFPMAKGGRPGHAVWIGIFACLLGGLIGGIFLVALTGPLASVALFFGPWEFFSLFILALSMVAGLVGDSLVKGLISALIGLVSAAIGPDPLLGTTRLTFGIGFLEGGMPFLPVLIGLFAFSQLMPDVEKIGKHKNHDAVGTPNVNLKTSKLAALRELLVRPISLLWTSLVGLWIGVLPAIGGSAANLMGYDQAKKISKHPEKFGTGMPEGIIAAESSNTANVAGSLIMMMAFGIPGDAVTAVMLGALILNGIAPGPLFISLHPHIAYGIFAAYLVALPVMFVLLFFGARFMLTVLKLPTSVMIPLVLVLAMIGGYALFNTMNAVYVLFIFCVIGYAMRKVDMPLAPLVMGAVLGNQIEQSLIRALANSSNPALFFTRPISCGLLVTAVLFAVFAVWQNNRSRKRSTEEG